MRKGVAADLRGEGRAGGLLQELLVTPLDTAVSLAQVNHIAVHVCQDLQVNRMPLQAIENFMFGILMHYLAISQTIRNLQPDLISFAEGLSSDIIQLE